MTGEMKHVTSAKKYFCDADHIIFNNFQTKSFLPVMGGCLCFPQASTRSPLFYQNSGGS